MEVRGQPKSLIKHSLKLTYIFVLLSVAATMSLSQSLVLSGPNFICSVKAHGVVHLAPGLQENLLCQNTPLRESTRAV